MSRVRGVLLFLLLALLFFVANRAAYQGWFYDDDLDNLIWTTRATSADFVRFFLDPFFYEFNHRPAAHIVYRMLGLASGMEYAPFVAVIHVLHLFNCWLVWLVVRRLGASIQGACAGTLLFAFHMACFDAYWKPMFMFDVVVTTYLLLAFLAWLHGRWLLALLPFFLACKSKELAVAFPALLLAYEYLLGERRWRRVIPFALIAAWLTGLGISHHAGSDNDYTLRFTPEAVWTTLRFYSSKILLVPYLGLALIPAALLTKDRRIRFGLLAIPILLGPLWFLPGRLFSVYLYLPLIGLAIAFAFAAERLKPVFVVALFALWLPWNYQLLREGRKAALTAGPENRAYYEQLKTYASQHPDRRAIVYDGGPMFMNRWGTVALLRWFYPASDFKEAGLSDPEAKTLLEQPTVTVLGWDRQYRKLLIAERTPSTPVASYIDMREPAPVWQFSDGWFPVEAGYRWAAPIASLTLRQTRQATAFTLAVNLGEDQRGAIGGVKAEVLIDGVSLGSRDYRTTGTHAQQWPLPQASDGVKRIEIRFSPAFRPSETDPRELGAAVAAIGFSEATHPAVP